MSANWNVVNEVDLRFVNEASDEASSHHVKWSSALPCLPKEGDFVAFGEDHLSGYVKDRTFTFAQDKLIISFGLKPL
ncbi:MAG TPA: hypothetical protein VH117_09270 [Edaphobacter sp.]|nr:hypothetical protein [Edaphobacter sp.]